MHAEQQLLLCICASQKLAALSQRTCWRSLPQGRKHSMLRPRSPLACSCTKVHPVAPPGRMVCSCAASQAASYDDVYLVSRNRGNVSESASGLSEQLGECRRVRKPEHPQGSHIVHVSIIGRACLSASSIAKLQEPVARHNATRPVQSGKDGKCRQRQRRVRRDSYRRGQWWHASSEVMQCELENILSKRNSVVASWPWPNPESGCA